MWVKSRQALMVVFAAWMLSVFTLIPALAQEDASAIPVQFDGHSFDLPVSLANGIRVFRVDVPSTVPGSDEPQPPHTEFRLEVYTGTVDVPPAAGWVNVYEASDLEGYVAAEQYARLQSLLTDRPDLSAEATLPTLYPYQQSALPPDRYTELFANASYLDAAGYQGITYIYARVVRIGDREPVVFYRVYFEGLSSDGQRYLSAQVEGLQELLVSLEGVTNYDEYYAQLQTLFNQPTDAAVVAWLDQANALFASFDYLSQ